ncbi:MAG: oligosaccharide flippase family protein [Firmicutes bacterium]|nr:oligosaccharide flippase family protein [Bacillota bacterium]
MKTFFGSVALITAFAVLTRGTGFIFRIVLSRVLGAELLGVYQIAFSFFMVFLTVIASGLPLIISRQISSGKTGPNHNTLVRSGMILSFTASALIIILVLFGQPLLKSLFTDQRSYSILVALVPAILAYSIYTILRAIWWGQKKYFLLGASELAEQIIRVILFLVFLTFSSFFADLAILASLSFTIACFLSAALVTILYLKGSNKSGKQRPAISTVGLLKAATPITIVRVLTVIAFPIIAVIVPMRLVAAGWDSTTAVAHFGIAVGMALPLLSIPQAVISSIAVALVPELSKANTAGDYSAVSKQINSCIKFTLLVNFALLPLFIALGPGIGQFLFANEAAGNYLRQSAWIMVPMSLSLITNAILNSLGRETRAMAHYIIGSAFLFLSIWFLPQFIGIGSLIVGIGVCMSIAALLNLHTIFRVTGSGLRVIEQLFGFALSAAPSGFIAWLVFRWLDFLPLFFRLGFASAPAFIVLIGIAYSLKLVDINTLKRHNRR